MFLKLKGNKLKIEEHKNKTELRRAKPSLTFGSFAPCEQSLFCFIFYYKAYLP